MGWTPKSAEKLARNDFTNLTSDKLPALLTEAPPVSHAPRPQSKIPESTKTQTEILRERNPM